MAVIHSDPFNLLGERQMASKVQITGTYRMPDGVHTRLKAGGNLPDGYELVEADPGFVVTAVKAEVEAPENKAEKPHATKGGKKATLEAKDAE